MYNSILNKLMIDKTLTYMFVDYVGYQYYSHHFLHWPLKESDGWNHSLIGDLSQVIGREFSDQFLETLDETW